MRDHMNDPRVPYRRDHDHEGRDHRLDDDPAGRLSGDAPGEAVPGATLAGETSAALPAPGNDGYSATALGSHWFERPGTRKAPGETAPAADGPRAGPPEAAPDRVEGEVLRFGPGVTALGHRGRAPHHTTAEIWHGTLAGHPGGPGPHRRRRGLRRYTLAAVVLAAVTAFLLWQRHGPGIAVERVAVTTTVGELGCDSTADIVGVVDTDGRPGTLVYRWLRSDGTTSGRLRERLRRGQTQTRLHLLWTFRGEGLSSASARLEIISPSPHRATTRFTYRCGQASSG
ncbi:hypothetical protein ACIBCM_08255 [Streptomyces sp. NPDC051018]|uniref:hypothetical protein n=1 Tax=Streptomyces sp. NPDC051018 TaxID=3365639 RepID=UPI0037A0ADC1